MEHQHKILSVNQNFPTFELTFDIQRLRVYGARLEFNWDGENVGKAYYKDFEILTEGSETILLMKQQIAACELKWQNINNIIDQEITAQIQEGGIIYNFVEEHGGGGSDKLLYEAVGYDTLNEKVLVTEGEQTLQQRLGEKLNSLESEKYPTSGITTTADLPADFVFTGENTMELMSIEVIKNPIDLDGITVWQTALPSLVSVSKETSETFVSPFVNGPQTFAGALPNLKNGDTFLSSPHLVSFCTKLPSLEYGYDMFIHSENLVSVDTELPLLSDGRQMFAETGIYSFDINLPSLLSGKQMFRDCKNLQSFTGNTPLLEEAEGMFTNCAELTEFKYMLPRLKNSTNMFQSCGFQEWKVALPSLVTADGMFQQNKSLTTFQLGTDKKHANTMETLESANAMFQNCDIQSWKIDMPALEQSQSMFDGNINLTVFQLGTDEKHSDSMSNLTVGSNMFKNCNLSTWKIDMPTIENGHGMFYSNKNLTTFQLGTDKLHADAMPNITIASSMFQNCNLTTWKIDMPVLENGDDMFNSNKNLTTFQLGANGSFANEITTLNTANGMFRNCNLSTWKIDMPALQSANYMFASNTSLSKFQLGTDSSHADTLSNLTSAIGMFMNCNLTSWNIELPNLKTAGNTTQNNGVYKDPDGMFSGNKITSWNIELPKLDNGNGMFQGNELTEWNIDLPNMRYGGTMFMNNKKLKSFTANVNKLEHARHYVAGSGYWGMFQGCTSLENFIEETGEDGVVRNCLKTTTSNEYMFSGCSSLETINTTFPEKNMSSRYLCAGCGNLKNFIVKNASGLSLVGDGIHLFDGCTNLDVWRSEKREEWTEADRGTFHHKFIGSLTRLAGGDSLFANCKKLKKFVTESMPGLLSHSAGCGAGSMFANCTALTTFCAKSLGSETRISDFPSTNSMFSGCVNLVEVKKEETDTLNSIDISCFVGAQNMFDGCSKLEQLSVKCEKLERARTTNMSSMFNGCTSLSDISFDEGSLASLTTASNMFARCDSITKESLLDMASKMPSLTGSHKIGIVNKFAEDVDIVSAFGMKGWTVVWV